MRVRPDGAPGLRLVVETPHRTETPGPGREISRFVLPETRIVAAGLDAAQVRRLTGQDPIALIDPATNGPTAPPCDLLIATAPALSQRFLTAAAASLGSRGALIVVCDVVAAARILSHETVRDVIRLLGATGFSILSPSRWLVPAEADTLTVIARHDGYVLRDYAPGDEAQILDLFEVSFGPRRSVDQWRWEYEANPNGNRAISLAFDAAGRLVAQYAGYPVALWCDDPSVGPLRANQIGDTMTARDVRAVGRGHTSLVVRTAKHFFASHCEGRVAFNYGFNTANIRRISSSFNESGPVERVPFRRLAVRGVAPPRLRDWARRVSKRWTVARETAVDAEWDRFFSGTAPAYRFLVRRDASHLRWRYLESPVWKYEILSLRSAGRLVGWSVFRRVGDSLVWGDALFAPGHAAGARFVLGDVLRSPIAQGAKDVVAWFPPRPDWWARVVADLGFEISDEPNDLSFMCTAFGSEDVVARLGDRFYYAACDSDLY